MSAGAVVRFEGMGALIERINRLGRLDRGEVTEIIAAEGEAQTRRRIQFEQTAPDGSHWLPWTENYARTRHGGQQLLMGSGHLLDSIVSESDPDHATWGSNKIYAAIQNWGGTPDMPPGPADVPARQYLGLSIENQDDIEALVSDWLAEKVNNL